MGQLIEHENASLVIAQRCSRISNGAPLFNSLLNYRHYVPRTKTDDMMLGIRVIWAQARTNYPLTVCVDDTFTELRMSSQTAEPVNAKRVCAYMQRALESIVENLTQEPEKSIDSIQVLPDSERQLLLETWNNVDLSAPDSVCIHQLFEKQAILTPTKTALIRGNERITYAELNTRANCLAHYLSELGVRPECLVGICVCPSFAMIVGLLAIHKAGGAYVPLDLSYPEQRVLRIIRDTELRIIIADEKGADRLRDQTADTLVLLNPNDRFDRSKSNPILRDLGQANLAYVMYTSGSTGQPKGVMVEHRNIIRLFESANSSFHFSQEDVWCLSHSITCDISVLEMWGALRYGGELVLVSRDVVRSPDARFDLILEHRVTAIVQTASEFSCIVEKLHDRPVIEHLRLVMIGSEYLDPRTLKPLYDALGDSTPQFMNLYGPTETTVFSTIKKLTVRDTVQSYSIIGKGLPDASIYLLDDLGRPAPLGVDGEIFIGGAGVARGYLNKLDLTSERFRENTFDNSLESRLYKTGDIARYLPDGDIVILGRNDEQTKIRGFRVETSEIVTYLVQYPGIRRAIVLPFGDAFEKFLIAYVVSEARENLAHDLRQYLTSLLPDYMIPAKFVRLDNLPLNTNGKLDHRALPMPDGASVARTSYEMPRTHTEWKLATIWCHLLGIDRVGREDNFFVVGGHSLLAVRMISHAEKEGLACTLNDLFHYPVLRDLASRIAVDSEIQDILSAIPVRPIGTEPPLFFVPTGFGDYSYAFALSQHIQTCCPIYALPWPPSQEQPSSTMEEMARIMIPLIKAVQPQGPYRICGYSAGGILCHAIACILHESGDSVTFVGLIDTTFREANGTRAQQRQLCAIGDLIATIGFERRNEIVRFCKEIDDMSFVEFIESGKQLKLYASNVRSEIHAQQLEQRVNFMEMAMSYVPKDLGIVVHQFNASEPNKIEEYLLGEIDFFGKGRRFDLDFSLPNTSFHIVPIPGDHVTMMENSNSRSTLGTAINVAIHPRS